MVTRPARLRYLIGGLLLALSLTACGGGDEPADAGESPPTTQSDSPTGTASGVLDFATVESLTAERFTSDKNCVIGIWSENETGIAEPYLATATTIQQFDCYRTEDQVAVGFPERLQQSIFVEFEDAAAADAFVQDQYYAVLLADSRVVVAGTGLKSVDMAAYLTDIQAACGCGEVVAGG